MSIPTTRFFIVYSIQVSLEGELHGAGVACDWYLDAHLQVVSRYSNGVVDKL